MRRLLLEGNIWGKGSRWMDGIGRGRIEDGMGVGLSGCFYDDGLKAAMVWCYGIMALLCL